MAGLTNSALFFMFPLLFISAQVSAMAVIPSAAGTCPPGSLMCLDGSQCYTLSMRCDGLKDCADTTDEYGCDESENTVEGNVTCSEGSILCKSRDQCFQAHQRCDKIEDCADGSDEYNCPVACEGEHLFTCGNGNCVSADLRCNGEDNCGDYTDEVGCGPPVDMNCTADEFVCPDGTCLSRARVCDGVVNCLGGSDEKGPCPSPEPSRESTASSEIESSTLDDKSANSTHSENITDEVISVPEVLTSSTNDNNTREPYQCKDHEFHCHDGSCIDMTLLCDMEAHCSDGSDEIEGCLIRTDCGNAFRCGTGHCLPREWVCDDNVDCVDGSDEEGCSKNEEQDDLTENFVSGRRPPKREVNRTDPLMEVQLEIAKQERTNQKHLYQLKVEELSTRNEAARAELKAALLWRDAMLERLEHQRKEHIVSLASLQGNKIELQVTHNETEVTVQSTAAPTA